MPGVLRSAPLATRKAALYSLSNRQGSGPPQLNSDSNASVFARMKSFKASGFRSTSGRRSTATRSRA